MTLAEFVNYWTGRPADYDGYYGDQCVDLVQYWSRNLGYPAFWGDAKDIIVQAGNSYTRVSGGYQPGDIMVWSGATPGSGGAGHTAIMLEPYASGFISFDQNWPGGSKPHRQAHDYSNVIGGLRPKNGVPSNGGIIVPVPTDILREVAGEVEGFDKKVYDGVYDSQLAAAWAARPVEDFIRHGFQQAINAGTLKYQLQEKIAALQKQVKDLQAAAEYQSAGTLFGVEYFKKKGS